MATTRKQEFADYAWQGNASGTLLESLRDVESFVYNRNTDVAIKRVQNLFRMFPDPSTVRSTGGCELENFGESRSPVRSVLIYALAAIKHEKMSKATSKNAVKSDGPKWCIIKIFEVFRAVWHSHRASETSQSKAILQFILKLMMVTYERVRLFVDPTFEHYDAVASSCAATFIAISCNFVKDANATKYSKKAMDLVSGNVNCSEEARARIYQVAGVAYKIKGDLKMAEGCLKKAQEFAQKMPLRIKNEARDEMLRNIEKDKNSLNPE